MLGAHCSFCRGVLKRSCCACRSAEYESSDFCFATISNYPSVRCASGSRCGLAQAQGAFWRKALEGDIAAGLEAMRIEEVQGHYETFAARRAAGKVSTNVQTWHDFLVDELLFKAAYVGMSKTKDTTDIAELGEAVDNILGLYEGVVKIVVDGEKSHLFSTWAKQRCQAAVDILLCGKAAGDTSSKCAPRHRRVNTLLGGTIP